MFIFIYSWLPPTIQDMARQCSSVLYFSRRQYSCQLALENTLQALCMWENSCFTLQWSLICSHLCSCTNQWRSGLLKKGSAQKGQSWPLYKLARSAISSESFHWSESHRFACSFWMMNEWCIYIALYCVLLYTQSALQSCGGGWGLSSTTTSVQHPLE